MNQRLKYKILLFCFACALCTMHAQAQQRASEKPLSAFYTAEMKKRMETAAPAQSHSVKRASQRPLSDFLTPEMQARLNARTPQAAVPSTVKRASQKPLSVFYSSAMKARLSKTPNAFSPAASPMPKN